MKRDDILELLQMLIAIVCILIACFATALLAVRIGTCAEKPTSEDVIQTSKETSKETSEVALVLYEDPQESEKIEAALDWHYIDNCTITAYCSCTACCGKEDGITATGTVAQEGVTIAVDPAVIPIGAWVEINGHQYHAEDVGGGVCGNHIDIYFDSHTAACDFGRQVESVRWYEG